MQKPSLVLTRPIRAFFNLRFGDVNVRLDQIEANLSRLERSINVMLSSVQKDVDETRELERAILDSLAYLGDSVSGIRAHVPSEE